MSKRETPQCSGWLQLCTTLVVSGVLTLFLAPPAVAAPPSNDDFADAVLVPGVPFSDTRDTSEATFTVADSGCGAATVWYMFTPAADGAYRFDTSGSDYDTTLAAFTYNGSRGFITCNNGAPGYQSAIDLQLLGGRTYAFEVGTCCTALEHGMVGPGGKTVFAVDNVPAFDLQLTLDPTGKVGSEPGTAMVSGTVTCNSPGVSYQVDIFGSLRQKQGLNVARGDFFTATPCSSTPTSWTAIADTGSRVFQPKAATLTATGSGCDQFGSCDQVSTTRTIKLRR